MPLNVPKRITRDTSAELLSKVDNFLFDCDGVIWNYPKPIPGAIDCINQLKTLGISKCNLLFVSFQREFIIICYAYFS